MSLSLPVIEYRNDMTLAMPAKFAERLNKLVRKKDKVIQYGAIGIDFGSDGLRLVQFRKNKEVLELYAAAHVSITAQQQQSSAQLGALIKQTLKENGFIGRQIVTCMQSQDVKIMMLSYMRQADKKDDELIVQRIADRIDGSIDDYVIDYMMVRPEMKEAKERSVLAAFADHDGVVNRLEHLRKSGLKVKVLEIESTAIRRLISVKQGDKHNANQMIISMGNTKTYITVLSGRRLIYERDIDFGEAQLIATLCKELDIDEHEARTMLERGNSNDISNAVEFEQTIPVTDALFSVLKPSFMELVEDINRALIYAASETRGLAVKHVYLTNQVATWHDIEKFINTLIEVPVSILLPFEGFENAAAFSADAGPRGAIAAGMALHGLTEFG